MVIINEFDRNDIWVEGFIVHLQSSDKSVSHFVRLGKESRKRGSPLYCLFFNYNSASPCPDHSGSHFARLGKESDNFLFYHQSRYVR